jgi:hypothetical protein
MKSTLLNPCDNKYKTGRRIICKERHNRISKLHKKLTDKIEDLTEINPATKVTTTVYGHLAISLLFWQL